MASLCACDVIIGARDRERSDTIVCNDKGCECAPGLADCDGDADNGCETNVAEAMVAECDGDPSTLCETKLRTDGEHCGSCERSCLGGECKDGLCVPQQIPNGNSVFEFVLRGDDVYYTSFFDPGVWKTSLSSADPATKIADTSTPAQMIRLKDDVLYFSTPTQVLSVLLAGGMPTVLANNVHPQVRMAVGGGQVYWVDLTDPNTYATTLLRMPISGGGMPEAVMAFDPNMQYGTDLVATDTDIYFTNGPGMSRSPHATVKVQPFVVTPSPPFYFFLDGAEFFMNCWDQGIFSVAAGGGTVTRLFDSPGEGAVTADADNVYFASTTDYIEVKIYRLSKKGGGAPVLLASNKDIVYSEPLTLDDKWIYWLTNTSGIRRVPK